MKVVAVTQARYGSTRLPAKILRKIGDLTLLDIHLIRILQSKNINHLMVATTVEEGADKIVEIADKYDIKSYKGSINDVLERFYFCVVEENPDYVVRLTSDCPLIDPEVIDKMIDTCLSSDYDYVSNTLMPTYPDGVDVEVFKFSALEKAYKEATLKSDREHVTPYIWRNSSCKGGNLFKSYNLVNNEDFSNYRITVDTEEDYALIKILTEKLGTGEKWNKYIDYIQANPDIAELNNHYTRNEGYAKSLLND